MTAGQASIIKAPFWQLIAGMALVTLGVPKLSFSIRCGALPGAFITNGSVTIPEPQGINRQVHIETSQKVINSSLDYCHQPSNQGEDRHISEHPNYRVEWKSSPRAHVHLV